MAFISDEYEIVFIHVPKTGGTSISHALARAHNSHLARPVESYAHSGVGCDVETKFRPNGIDVHDPWPTIVRQYPRAVSYLPVAVVRNPWARIYSFYWHKRRRRDADLPRKPDGSFYSLADTFRISNVCLLQPQVWWFPERTRVIRFENMPADLGGLGCGLPPEPIRKLNTRPGGSERWREAFDNETADLIHAHYRFEIETYGYSL